MVEFQTDKYVLKGEGVEIWEPRFTYHGFRYVEVTGFPDKPTPENLCGCVVHTSLESLGEFECSNEMFNAIQECARRSTLTNFHGVPTDCPHREKNPWTGDAQVSAEQALLNFNPTTAYMKWMRDFKDVQRKSGQLPGIVPTGGWGFNWGSGPAWDSAVILIPWYVYLYKGDISLIEEMYSVMTKYIDFMSSMAYGHIVNFGLGDWCPPEGGPSGHKCPAEVTDTAYYFIDALIVSKIAVLLNKREDAAKYGELAKNIRKAFREKFIDFRTGTVKGDCQTSYACVLYQGLADEDEEAGFLEKLVSQVKTQNEHIDCGILGAKYIMHALTEFGRADLAYGIANQRTFPGWGYWIEQGATTLWEKWNGDSSRNHHMFSDISAWFYKGLAGINPDPEEPGFKHIILRPNPVEGLTWVNCSHHSMYGKIVLNWIAQKDKLRIKVEVPVNCRAILYIPHNYSKDVRGWGRSDKSNFGICILKDKRNNVVCEIQSGAYEILALKVFNTGFKDI